MGYSLFIKNFLEIGFENNLAQFLNGYISFVPPTVRFVLLSGGLRFVFGGFWFNTKENDANCKHLKVVAT